jgi:hypothetical protein
MNELRFAVRQLVNNPGFTVDLKNIPREKLDGDPRMAAALRAELPGN